MKSIPIRWMHLDRCGSVRAAYVSPDGKFRYPEYVGVVIADIRRPCPPFDCENIGACYRIDGELVVVESCSSRVFKPLSVVLKSAEERHPALVNPYNGALATRASLTMIPLP